MRVLIVILLDNSEVNFNAVNLKNATDIFFDQVKGLRLGLIIRFGIGKICGVVNNMQRGSRKSFSL